MKKTIAFGIQITTRVHNQNDRVSIYFEPAGSDAELLKELNPGDRVRIVGTVHEVTRSGDYPRRIGTERVSGRAGFTLDIGDMILESSEPFSEEEWNKTIESKRRAIDSRQLEDMTIAVSKRMDELEKRIELKTEE